MKSNPFATRFVHPGAVPWFVAEQEHASDIPNLLRRWRHELNRCGALVGPHGSGKSTLLVHLAAELGPTCYRSQPGIAKHAAKLRAANDDHAGMVVWIQLRRGHRPLRDWLNSRGHWAAGRTLIVDGWEQLPIACRAFLGRVMRWQEMGLLVSSHARVAGIPTLLQMQVTAELARRIVEHLAEQAAATLPADWLNDARLRAQLEEHRGNMRELLMRLYDDYHNQCATQKSAVGSGDAPSSLYR
ncbi:MAG: hypothetical protein NXI32_05380 [bacterium]|nr:hypothetical protein [bacterium]